MTSSRAFFTIAFSLAVFSSLVSLPAMYHISAAFHMHHYHVLSVAMTLLFLVTIEAGAFGCKWFAHSPYIGLPFRVTLNAVSVCLLAISFVANYAVGRDSVNVYLQSAHPEATLALWFDSGWDVILTLTFAALPPILQFVFLSLAAGANESVTVPATRLAPAEEPVTVSATRPAPAEEPVTVPATRLAPAEEPVTVPATRPTPAEIREALARTGGSRILAAKVLGVPPQQIQI